MDEVDVFVAYEFCDFEEWVKEEAKDYGLFVIGDEVAGIFYFFELEGGELVGCHEGLEWVIGVFFEFREEWLGGGVVFFREEVFI